MMPDDSEASHWSTKLEPMNPAPPVTTIVSGCIDVGVTSAIILHFARFVRWRWLRAQAHRVMRKELGGASCASCAPLGCPQFARPHVRPTSQEFPSSVGEKAASG